MYGKLDIEGKELPKDFLEYFTEEGIEKKNPYDFSSKKCFDWCDRQCEIAFMFMANEQIESYYEVRRNWQAKVESSFGS